MRVCAQNEIKVYEGVLNGELEIDGEGRIWRVAFRWYNRITKEIEIKACGRRRAEIRNEAGYLTLSRRCAVVDVSNGLSGGRKLSVMAHRLVWYHFFGGIPTGLTINHKNGDKHCNHPDNLELATDKEQIAHSIHVLGNDVTGVANPRSKLTARDVIEIRRRAAAGESQPALAAEFLVTKWNIGSIVRMESWKEVGGIIVRSGQWKGEQIPQAKLTAANVMEIRRLASLGEAQTSLADEFRVSRSQICRIINRETWKHIG